MRNLVAALSLLVLLGLAPTGRTQSAAHPFLHPLFTDNMVIQRGIKAPVWGWTAPGKEVTVSIEGKSAKAVADAQGKWTAKIGPFPAGGPYTLKISGPESVTLKNVLFGDVWVCSGQSNMEMGIGNVTNAQDEIAAANNPNIRLYTVPKLVAYAPVDHTSGNWAVCTPQTVANGGWNGFTAAGYFFGRTLNKELNVPIGLIHTSWGGTIAEAWTSAEALNANMPEFRTAVAQVEKTGADLSKGAYDYDKKLAEWWSANDPGSKGGIGWAAADFDTSSWKTMTLPTAWEQAGLPDYDGVVWFQKTIDLPASAAGKEATLRLGAIDDEDTTWINGVQVGSINSYNTPRVYKVAAGVLKEGKNVIAVRVLDTGGAGGFTGTADQMSLEVSGESPVSLAGDWVYKDSAPLNKTTPVPQQTSNNPNVVTVLYNGMIAPILPFGIKGAVWYQGESNAGAPYQYRTLLPTMIKDWRARFGVGEFPFYIVQLANFMQVDSEPKDDAWPLLREAQWLTTKTVPNTGLALAIDIGDATDIHPKNKQEVGRRLALNALALAYGKKIVYSGPVYKSMKKEGSKIRLTFDHVGGGLVAKDETLKGFAIAGEDKHFVWANAVIDGDTVVVSSDMVGNPVAVRYAWGNNPVANLYNKADLPTVPFRTDQWRAPNVR